MNSKKLNTYVKIAILAAMSFLLQLLGTFIGLKVGGFLDVEISDFPALIGTFALGPAAGVLIELFKNILHCSVTSTGFVGELANFIVNGIFVLTAGIIYKFNRTRRGAVISMLISVLAMSAAGIFANLFILLPLYMPQANLQLKMNIIMSTITPFNLCKGFILSFITFICYKKLKPLLFR